MKLLASTSAAFLLSCSLSHAQEAASASQSRDAGEECQVLGHMAKSIMRARQHNFSLLSVMKVTRDLPDPKLAELTREIVIEAYERPYVPAEAEKIAADYQKEVQTACDTRPEPS
ncbi:hypothetical protein [Falsirhodobacter sp. 1013]|uniref:hypothetical protein n=1 Tax=Falsirhodobacter sp. 1013 TaxID=3417566 RepID=UPI003EBE30AB